MSTPEVKIVKRTVLAVSLLAALLFQASNLLADNVDITTSFSGSGSGVFQTGTHTDADPFKGSLQLTVTNTGTASWGDFHFAVFSVGWDVTNVDFVDFDTQAMVALPPTLNNVVVDSWTIAPNGSSMDIFFYSTPIDPGETAVIKVYTDNTVSQVPFFGTMFWPTPVPEPASMAVLGLGLGVLALRRRK
jgi:hypothetical protein